MSNKGLGHLQSILSKMKIQQGNNLRAAVKKYGNSDMFRYATKSPESLGSPKTLPVWDALEQYDTNNCYMKLPLNGFEQMIQLTEQGKLWRYPIDNEQGMDEEKQVPFEDHVFLDNLLDDFPKNENIQNFMNTIISGLARNHWMTVDRKHEVIKFYKDYFEEKKDIYKQAGYEI